MWTIRTRASCQYLPISKHLAKTKLLPAATTTVARHVSCSLNIRNHNYNVRHPIVLPTKLNYKSTHTHTHTHRTHTHTAHTHTTESGTQHSYVVAAFNGEGNHKITTTLRSVMNSCKLHNGILNNATTDFNSLTHVHIFYSMCFLCSNTQYTSSQP